MLEVKKCEVSCPSCRSSFDASKKVMLQTDDIVNAGGTEPIEYTWKCDLQCPGCGNKFSVTLFASELPNGTTKDVGAVAENISLTHLSIGIL